MRNSLKTYVSRKFVELPLSADIIYLQDIICSMMHEKFDDCKSKGMSDFASYNQAIKVVYL